jgi:hypothetical protein
MNPSRPFRRAAFLLLLWAPALHAAGPRTPRPSDPVVSIPIADLGFDPIQPRFLTGGATMFTLNFVDDTHLLVTFNTHGLIPRMPDTVPGDDDRLVDALLLELPSGKVLARTQWHTRDREQYLWPLSHGLFLLRIRNTLTVIDPLRNLAAGAPDPFKEQGFLHMDRRIGYISVSPGGDLLVVETVPAPRSAAEDDAARFAAAGSGKAPSQDQTQSQSGPSRPVFHVDTDSLVQIHLYRMSFSAATPGEQPRLRAQAAGLIAAQKLIRVPATADGFLDIYQESAHTWLFDFQSHAGKRVELSPFDTECAPSPWFISRTDFVSLGCTGSDTKVELSGFDLRGEEPWIQILSGAQIAPEIVSSPASGRFAFSRILVASTFYDIQNLLPEELSGQEIEIIQNHDGRILLKVQASPIQRTGQNFDLSPDGLSFTVIRNNVLEVYHLPALTSKDQDQLRLVATSTPEPNQNRILLVPLRTATAKNSLPNAPNPSAAVQSVDDSSNLSAPAAPKANAGDVQPSPDSDTPRTPPSLYGPNYPKPPKP